MCSSIPRTASASPCPAFVAASEETTPASRAQPDSTENSLTASSPTLPTSSGAAAVGSSGVSAMGRLPHDLEPYPQRPVLDPGARHLVPGESRREREQPPVGPDRHHQLVAVPGQVDVRPGREREVDPEDRPHAGAGDRQRPVAVGPSERVVAAVRRGGEGGQRVGTTGSPGWYDERQTGTAGNDSAT